MQFNAHVQPLITKLKQGMRALSEHQSRLWVVTIKPEVGTSDTFVIDEDQFREPLQWMVKKGYSSSMLQQVQTMPRSGVLVWQVGNQKHQLLRVK
jgi:hypothetical protein